MVDELKNEGVHTKQVCILIPRKQYDLIPRPGRSDMTSYPRPGGSDMTSYPDQVGVI